MVYILEELTRDIQKSVMQHQASSGSIFDDVVLLVFLLDVTGCIQSGQKTNKQSTQSVLYLFLRTPVDECDYNWTDIDMHQGF